jgi:hypothetical protein
MTKGNAKFPAQLFSKSNEKEKTLWDCFFGGGGDGGGCGGESKGQLNSSLGRDQ